MATSIGVVNPDPAVVASRYSLHRPRIATKSRTDSSEFHPPRLSTAERSLLQDLFPAPGNKLKSRFDSAAIALKPPRPELNARRVFASRRRVAAPARSDGDALCSLPPSRQAVHPHWRVPQHDAVVLLAADAVAGNWRPGSHVDPRESRFPFAGGGSVVASDVLDNVDLRENRPLPSVGFRISTFEFGCGQSHSKRNYHVIPSPGRRRGLLIN